MTPISPSRRRFLAVAGIATTSAMSAQAWAGRNERGWRSDVFIARAGSYSVDLRQPIIEGLEALGIVHEVVRGKTVLLKPNLVEPAAKAPHINTHPTVVLAAAEAFRCLGAASVLIAEGQGHVRDTELVLDESGLGAELRREGLPFVDLNHDEVDEVPNALRLTGLKTLWLPRAVRTADIVVSMPKMKTHHWAGATLSMKNLFGIMPGVCYGWPKNVLHREGIPQSILDINATARPHLAIVDGIVGMEGDGPIMGTPIDSGLLVMGTNLTAVDATAARLMRLDPSRIAYLAGASGRLGPIAESHIGQRGESIASLAQTYALLDHPSLAGLRA
ncbi:DUF362 domain-containing protein [Isosphaeraceae bacterium EP7]